MQVQKIHDQFSPGSQCLGNGTYGILMFSFRIEMQKAGKKMQTGNNYRGKGNAYRVQKKAGYPAQIGGIT